MINTENSNSNENEQPSCGSTIKQNGERKMSKKILVVEDQEAYSEAAKQYFATRSDVDVDYAVDYDDAMSKLEKGVYAGVVTDCFFPKKKGSGNTDIGKKTIEKIMDNTSHGIFNKCMKEFGKYVDLEDEEMRDIAVNFSWQEYKSFNLAYEERREHHPNLLSLLQIPNYAQDDVFQSLERIARADDKKTATRCAKKSLESYKIKRDSGDAIVEDYAMLMQNAIEELEANQPLGVLVAEKAEEIGLPFVLATSTFHHDKLTQPIFDYSNLKGWNFVDSEIAKYKDKDTTQYWEVAHNRLRYHLPTGEKK